MRQNHPKAVEGRKKNFQGGARAHGTRRDPPRGRTHAPGPDAAHCKQPYSITFREAPDFSSGIGVCRCFEQMLVDERPDQQSEALAENQQSLHHRRPCQDQKDKTQRTRQMLQKHVKKAEKTEVSSVSIS